jgi:hypothetical protein
LTPHRPNACLLQISAPCRQWWWREGGERPTHDTLTHDTLTHDTLTHDTFTRDTFTHDSGGGGGYSGGEGGDIRLVAAAWVGAALMLLLLCGLCCCCLWRWLGATLKEEWRRSRERLQAAKDGFEALLNRETF